MITNTATAEHQQLLNSTYSSSGMETTTNSINWQYVINVVQHLFTIGLYILNILTDIMILILYYTQNRIIAFYIVIAALIITQLSHCIFFIILTTEDKKWYIRILYTILLIPISFFIPFIIYLYGLDLIPQKMDDLLTERLHFNIPSSWKQPNTEQDQLGIFYMKDSECFGFTLSISIQSIAMTLIQIFVICYHPNIYIPNIQIFSLFISLISITYQIRGCHMDELNNKLHAFMTLCITMDLWRCALMVLLVYNYMIIFYIWLINISLPIILQLIFAIGVAVEAHSEFVDKVKEFDIIKDNYHKIIKIILWIIAYFIGFILALLFAIVTFILFQYCHFHWLNFITFTIHTNFFEYIKKDKRKYWKQIYDFITQSNDYYYFGLVCKHNQSSHLIKRICIVNYFMNDEIDEQNKFCDYLQKNEFDNYLNVSFKSIRNNNVLLNESKNKIHILFKIYIGLGVLTRISGVIMPIVSMILVILNNSYDDLIKLELLLFGIYMVLHLIWLYLLPSISYFLYISYHFIPFWIFDLKDSDIGIDSFDHVNKSMITWLNKYDEKLTAQRTAYIELVKILQEKHISRIILDYLMMTSLEFDYSKQDS